MARDLFEESGISPSSEGGGRDLFAESGIELELPKKKKRTFVDEVKDLGLAAYTGAKSMGRSLSAAGDTVTGDLAGVEATAADQKAAAEDGPQASRDLLAEIDARKKANPDGGVIDAVRDIGGAMIDNPRGAGQFVVEQAPNSLVSLGAGAAGAKVGAMAGGALGSVVPVVGTAAGAAAGGIAGFLGGMFLGNAALETGGKAIEKADGGFTEGERGDALKEGAVKGAVITGVDAVTLGAGGKVAKTFNKAAIKAGAQAEAKVLVDAGVDVSSRAAVEAALAGDKVLLETAKAAGKQAAAGASKVGSRAAAAGTVLGLETVGEGTGEYLGELAATGKADVYDATLESLAGVTQSAPETAYSMAKSQGNDLSARGIAESGITGAPAPATPANAATAPVNPPATPSNPTADPTTRLAELELTAGTRDLTEPERQEAAALFEQLQAAEDADNQGPADVENPTQPPAASAQPEAQGAEATAPEGSDGAAAAGSAAEPGAGGLETAGVSADTLGLAVYQITKAPPYEGMTPMDAADADFQLEVMGERAAAGTLTPEMFAASDIGRQIEMGVLTGIKQGLSADPVGTINALRARLAQNAEPAEADTGPILPPMQDGPDVNLQNRDRGRAASVVQMTEIARNPDYMRLGPSRTPDSGAPMVFAVGDNTAAIPPENFGREDLAVMSDGQQVGFRYAVADATKVNPSNFADGRANEAFNSDLPGTIKALNNGRTAGVRAAHEMGTAGQYVEAMQGDAQMHGISPDVIARTPNPILVRVYADADNTAGMAAKSQGQGLGMSPSELARQDAPLMDSSVLGVYQPGDVTSAGNRDFVRAFVGKLQGAGQDVAAMMTGNGELSQDGRKRIQAALMQAAYGDFDLVEEMFDSTDTDIKAIGEALKAVAGEWANMRDSARLGAISPDADITENLLQALGLIRKARRERTALTDLVNQPDLLTGQAPDVATVGVLRLFYSGKYFTRAIGRDTLAGNLTAYVRGAMDTSAEPGMFGDDVSPQQILAALSTLNPGDTDAKTQPENSGAAPTGGSAAGVGVAQGERGERRPVAAPGRAGSDRGGQQKPAENQDQAQQQDGQGNQGGAQGEGEGGRGEVKRPQPSPQPTEAEEQAARDLLQVGMVVKSSQNADSIDAVITDIKQPDEEDGRFQTTLNYRDNGVPRRPKGNGGTGYIAEWFVRDGKLYTYNNWDKPTAWTFEAKAEPIGKKPAKPAKPKAGKVAEPRTLLEDGRASDGKPINAGDVFNTLSGRVTTGYPKQAGQKYASQWLINNAILEAESRGDGMNTAVFTGEKPLKDGTLPTASRESMLMYLFGEQPAVVPSILKPLVRNPKGEGNAAIQESGATPVDGEKPSGNGEGVGGRDTGGREATRPTGQGTSAGTGAAAGQTGASTQPRTEGGRQDEGTASDFLTAPTAEDILAQQERAEAAQRKSEADARAAAELDRRAREKADIKKASEAAADTFVLGGDAMANLSGQTDIFGMPAEPEPSAADQAKAKAADDLKNALGDLADIFGKDFKANMLPEQEQKLLPVLTRLMDAAFRLGYLSFKDAAKYALDQIRAALGKEIADEISLDQLQGAYIGMAGRYKEQGAESARAVVQVEDKADIEKHTARVAAPKESSNEPGPNGRVERDRQEPGAQPAVGDAVSPGARPAADGARPTGGQASGEGGSRQSGGAGVSPGGAAAGGNRGDLVLSGGNPPVGPALVTPGDQFGERGGDSGLFGIPADPIPAAQVDAAAQGGDAGLTLEQRQRAAQKIPVKPGDIDNIRATLPYLLAGQQDDVGMAEAQFAKPDGYGMLFTNGTGTGKTFSGLGVVKRFERQGKTNVLIVVPDDKIASDWMDSGKPLALNISQLTDTKSAGKGIVVTTYANLGANDELARRDWDLVVADEAHSLMQSADGKMTGYLANLRAITLHPDGAYTRFAMLNREEIAVLADLSNQIDANDKILSNPDTMDVQVASLREQNAKLNAKRAALNVKLNDARDAIKEDMKKRQGPARTRLVALSATPFAYEYTIDWANGYLFDYNEGRQSEENTFRGYNEGTNREQFFMQHFGYSMRYNKLNKPDPSKVDTGMMQRNFNTMLKKRGSLAGRMLDVDADYDRRFILVDSAIGNDIDAALEWVSEQARGAAKGEGGMGMLRDILAEKFDYLSRRYLLEAIKATESVAIVKQHLAMGRKVVVFHDYKKGGGFNPFDLQPMGSVQAMPGDDAQAGADQAQRRRQYNAALVEFRAKFKDLVEAPLGQMASPIAVFKREFPDVLLINGDEKQSDLLKRYKTFQDDSSGPLVALVQSAKNKGWSGHDTTGKHQRVLINLGQPTAPTLAIQQEGRIYRTGQVTDAIMRYLNTGTNWEKWAFATTIAGRASTAENLGMGELARALKDSFIAAFEESDAYPPGHEGEGKGGKERDKAANNAMSEWDRAKTYYWGTQKKNSRTKAQEGVDYFATPEPVGLKMVEFLALRGGEDTLEPSAGHGAISRWLPDNTNRTVIEPSNALRSRLAMAMDTANDRIIGDTFENHAVVNKYDGIVMNPPFGVGGKTAIEHLAKAATHLRDGGRIVALIPTGPAADKRFEKWMYGKEERPTKPLGTLTIDGKVTPVYKGDTIESRASWAPTGIVTAFRDGSPMVRAVEKEFNGTSSMVSEASVKSVKPTGKRTEEFSPAAGLYLVADIQLPGVTFERASTGVMTRIVVIEKQLDAARAPMQRNTDLRDIEDVNKLFDRMENMSLPQRRMTAAQETRSTEEKAAEEAAAKKEDAKAKRAEQGAKAEKPGKAAKPGKAPAVEVEVGSTITLGGKPYTVDLYVTNGGKELRGVWVATKAEALTYGPSTFEKRGKGFFVRERDFKPEGGTTLSIDGEQKRVDTSSYGTATQAHRDLAARLNASFAARIGGGPDTNLLDAVAPSDAGTGRAAKAVRALARRLFGREVVFVRFTGKQIFNGAVSSTAPGVLFINIDSQRPYMAVLGHELLHQMAQTQPGIYAGLSQALDKFIKNEMTYGLRTVAAYRAAGIDLKGLDTREELEADIMGDAFVDPLFWDAIAQDQPSLFKRLAAGVMQWLDSVISKIGNQRPFGTDEFLTDVNAARNAVADAVRRFSAAEVGAVTDPLTGGERLSVAGLTKTDTPAFRKWFGDSKVVDAEGKPRVMYHGTSGDITEFEPDNNGLIFVTPEPAVANSYAESSRGRGFPRSAPNIMPVYARALRPFDQTVEADRNLLIDRLMELHPTYEQGDGQPALLIDGRRTLYTEGVLQAALADDQPSTWALLETPSILAIVERTGFDSMYVTEDGVKNLALFDAAQLKSAIGNRGTFDPDTAAINLSIFGNPVPPGQPTAWNKLKARVNALTSRESLDRLVYEYQDKLVDLKRIRDHIKDIGGTITDLNDAYLGEELYHKRVAKRTQDFLADELKPLLADMRLRGVDMPTLEKYLHARHAPEANKAMAERNPNKLTIDTKRATADAQVRALERQLQTATNNGSSTKALTQALDQAREERARWVGAQAFKGTEADRLSLSGMSDQEATSLMTGLSPRKRADLDALAAKIDAINAKTVNTLEAYGLMDSPSLNAWRNAYQFYVPLHRDEAHPDSTSHPVGQGFSTKGNASKQRTGSNAKVTNILGHIAMQREAALTRGEKNQVVKKLYVLAAQNPDKSLWAVDKVPMVKTIDRDTGLVRSNIDPTYKNKPNVLMVRISGKDAAIVFNEQNPNAMRLAESMKNLDVGDLDAFSNIMAKGTRWLASVNTQYNPIFGLVNFARDVQGATLQLSSTAIAGAERQVLADTPSALRAIYRQVRGKKSTGPWTKLWEELQNEGGTTGYRELFMKPEDRAKELERELKALDRGQAVRAAVAVVDWLSDFNEAIENGVRLATYKAALDQGLSKPRAASLAKNITVNFNRRGRQTAKLGAYYAFLNAAIQGTTRMVETLKGPAGKKIMLGGVMLGALNTLLGMAIMGAGDDDEDEDNWGKIPDFVKERNVIIPLGREDYLTIPMPLGFNVLPNIGRKAVEMMMHDDPTESRGKHVGDLALIILDSFNPFGGSENLGQLAAPTVFDPVVALMQNKDWTGRQIFRADQSTLDPTPGFTRTKDSASSFSKGVAEAMNTITGGNDYKPGAISWTPDQIDFIVGTLTGGIGRELMKVEQTVTSPFTGEELPAYKIPIAGRLYGNTSGPANNSEKFYENVRQLNMVENELKGRAGDGNDPEGFIESEPLAAVVGAGNAAESQLRKLRAARRAVIAQGTDGYLEQVKDLNEQQGQVMKDLNRQVRDAKRAAQ